MIKRILLSIDFGSAFVSIPLNILDIELEKDLDTDELKNFNISIWIYLIFEREYEEFTVMEINFNTVRGNDEEYPYNEDNLYFESNNVRYNNII